MELYSCCNLLRFMSYILTSCSFTKTVSTLNASRCSPQIIHTTAAHAPSFVLKEGTFRFLLANFDRFLVFVACVWSFGVLATKRPLYLFSAVDHLNFCGFRCSFGHLDNTKHGRHVIRHVPAWIEIGVKRSPTPQSLICRSSPVTLRHVDNYFSCTRWPPGLVHYRNISYIR